ncbi:MAG: NAD-dependent epimerase/dehydratase family protein [Actinomycetota bacterium]
MGSSGSRVRSRRSAAGDRRAGPVVAVTGAASVVGVPVTRALARRLAAGAVSRVVAVDDRRGPVDDAHWRIADLSQPSVLECLEGADVVVHVACPADLEAALAEPPPARRARAVRTAQAVFTAAAAAGAHRLVVVTSATVYGASADQPIPLAEDAPLRAVADSGLVGDMLEVEELLARVPRAHPGLRTTVVRPAALVGEGVDTMTTRHFEAPRLLVASDVPTVWQFCHVDDLAEAVATAVVADLDGALTAGCEGVLTQQAVERISGMRRLELPVALALGTAQRLHRARVLPMPPEDLAYVVYPWVVPSTRLRQAGWRPRYDNETCLGVLLEQVRGRHALAGRRVERRDAALGAAGAAVALVGTAAAWRQARVRRRRAQ